MRTKIIAFLLMVIAPFALCARAREGTPVYYQNQYAPVYQPAPSSTPSQPIWIGDQPTRQIVGQRTYSYQVPRGQNPWQNGGMTPNGVSIPPSNDTSDVIVKGEVVRRFADFEFKTGVQSILNWNDMVFNEIGLRAEKNFQLRNFDLFAYGEYRQGTMASSGLSMDYDLEPYDPLYPEYGIFTISMGGQTGSTRTTKVGIGARNVWDFHGWKLSPSIGYQIFKHNLTMTDHIYPNPPVYIPLMTEDGDYIFIDGSGNYFSAPPMENIGPGDYYQICMSPEDMKLAITNGGIPQIDGEGNLITGDYDPWPGSEYLPWGVGPGDCVVIGGDGMIIVRGTTHIYNTTWSGLYLGLEIEKQMTYVDKLRFYIQASMPHYKSEGTWPNRTDWQQNPSFIDEGDASAMHYQAEMEYIYTFGERLQLSLKASMDYFHIGNVPGELYVAGYQYYVTDDAGNIMCDASVLESCVPLLATQPAYTEKISDSLQYATWRSFALHLGVRYAF